jgi:hypothetical protein
MSAEDIINSRFAEYALALGKVAHSWNFLQETLCSLFAVVVGNDQKIAFAVWYSSTSDRGQREMLKAAANSATLSRPQAKEDIVWLVDKTNNYSERRNDAIHAPCAMGISSNKFEIVPAFFNGHPRAKSLLGKDILKEFAWYESLADKLAQCARQLETALNAPSAAWPNRPSLPSLGAKSAPLNQIHLPPLE